MMRARRFDQHHQGLVPHAGEQEHRRDGQLDDVADVAELDIHGAVWHLLRRTTRPLQPLVYQGRRTAAVTT
jgi:phage major head subunit gpT-like protein